MAFLLHAVAPTTTTPTPYSTYSRAHTPFLVVSENLLNTQFDRGIVRTEGQTLRLLVGRVPGRGEVKERYLSSLSLLSFLMGGRRHRRYGQ